MDRHGEGRQRSVHAPEHPVKSVSKMIQTVFSWLCSIFKAPHNDLCRISRDKDELGNDVGGFYLDYSSRRFKHFQLPEGISPEDVTRLNLEKTNLKAIPPNIFEMSNLKELDLRHNRLTSIPPEIRNLHRLRVLKLAMNSLKKLPEDIGEMESLEVLHLGANELTRLPKKFRNLKLKVIWINDNCFEDFPFQITQIKTIEELYVHGNKITKVPEEIGELSNMTCFYIHKNKLNSLPRAIVTLMKSKLTDFDYHANRCLKVFPPGFDQAVSKITLSSVSTSTDDDDDVSKINDTSDPHCKHTKHKSLGVKQKQTKSNKSASTTVAAKVKEDNVVDAKATEEQAVASVTESLQLHAAAPENMQLTTATSHCLSTLQVKQDGGAKGINVFNIQVYLNGGNSIGQSVNNTDFIKDKNTMDTKNPLKDLILHIKDTACSDWKNIARRLDVNDNEIKRIQGENPGQMKECCIEVLNLWRKERGKDATIQALKEALYKVGRKDVVDEFDAANCGGQDVATGDSGQVEEETSIMEAAGCNGNVESDGSRHSLREATIDQVQDPQATTQPTNATSTLPKQPIEEGSRRCVCPNSNTSHQEKRPQKDEQRSLTSTNAELTSIESQPGRRSKQYNRWNNKWRPELNQTPTEGGRRPQSRPGSNSSVGYEKGASNKYRFPFKKNKTNQGPESH